MENILIDGRYLLLSALGSGGEARVFRAQDNTEEVEVAVRIARRLGAIASPCQPMLFHESWVRLFASGIDPQHGAYQVYEFLEGQTLGQLIRSGPLDPNSWHAFVDQSLASIEALHAAGWTHGDLNANNFFQTSSGWRLLELPFFRFNPPKGRSAVFGSIHTIAPEQFDGKRPDVRSDLYALGCLYYYAASGVWPHPGTSSQEVAINCLRFAPDSLAEKASHLPAAWSAWIMTLLSRDARQRPEDAPAARHLLGLAVA